MGRPAYWPWLLLSPALLLLGFFVFWPVIYLVGLSLTSGSFTRAGVQWVGLRHYSRLVTDPDFWQALGNSLGYTLATVIPSLGLGLGLALLLNRRHPGAGVVRTLYFLPSVTSLAAAGLAFRWLFQTEGPVNGALGLLGFAPFSWLADPWGARAVLVLLSIWVQVGFNWVVLLAGLQAIPHHLYEAAGLDGATSWQQFWWITLPNLRPALVFAAVTTTLFSLRSFEPVYVVT
ncbi:MAG: sugar ABC transporter permease, partial [Gloeomargaritaceae cyanobacterium C42_A2020_066]|nr:sugar ABC transporter permease [Gloeomargaritaceae cyanobacterium C42_A2020_066]